MIIHTNHHIEWERELLVNNPTTITATTQLRTQYWLMPPACIIYNIQNEWNPHSNRQYERAKEYWWRNKMENNNNVVMPLPCHTTFKLRSTSFEWIGRRWDQTRNDFGNITSVNVWHLNYYHQKFWPRVKKHFISISTSICFLNRNQFYLSVHCLQIYIFYKSPIAFLIEFLKLTVIRKRQYNGNTFKSIRK